MSREQQLFPDFFVVKFKNDNHHVVGKFINTTQKSVWQTKVKHRVNEIAEIELHVKNKVHKIVPPPNGKCFVGVLGFAALSNTSFKYLAGVVVEDNVEYISINSLTGETIFLKKNRKELAPILKACGV